MKYGVCGGPDLGYVAKEAGYDYFEWSVGGLLNPRADENIFEESLRHARAVGLPCPVVNVFVPADLKITGPAVDAQALENFTATALRRAQQAGVQVIVFGSGGARNLPEGFDRQRGWQQLVDFCRMLGPLAQSRGVTIGVEPLNRGECNVINTVAEGAALVREVDHPNILLTVDGYHWAKDRGSVEEILNNASLFAHAHIAAVEGRRPPNPLDSCGPFLMALQQAGYDGRLSIEGSIEDPRQQLPEALRIMQSPGIR